MWETDGVSKLEKQRMDKDFPSETLTVKISSDTDQLPQTNMCNCTHLWQDVRKKCVNSAQKQRQLKSVNE